jgi:hypothetical protein
MVPRSSQILHRICELIHCVWSSLLYPACVVEVMNVTLLLTCIILETFSLLDVPLYTCRLRDATVHSRCFLCRMNSNWPLSSCPWVLMEPVFSQYLSYRCCGHTKMQQTLKWWIPFPCYKTSWICVATNILRHFSLGIQVTIKWDNTLLSSIIYHRLDVMCTQDMHETTGFSVRAIVAEPFLLVVCAMLSWLTSPKQ